MYLSPRRPLDILHTSPVGLVLFLFLLHVLQVRQGVRLSLSIRCRMPYREPSGLDTIIVSLSAEFLNAKSSLRRERVNRSS